MMLDTEQERLCRMIDQRNKDRAAVAQLARKPDGIAWTGTMSFGLLNTGCKRQIRWRMPDYLAAAAEVSRGPYDE